MAQRRVPRRYWNAQNRQNQNQNQNYNQQQNQQQNQDNQSRRKKKKNSPKRYYPKNYQQNQGSMGGGQQMNNMNDMVGGSPMGGNNMRGSPSKRGYYRPRQPAFKQNQQQPQYKQRRGPNQSGGTYMIYLRIFAYHTYNKFEYVFYCC